MSEKSATKNPSIRRRTAARLAAVQALYQIDITDTPVETVVAEFVHHRLGRDVDDERLGEVDNVLFADVVRGASKRRDDLDRVIGAALTPDWPLERLETVLRAILRAGAYELLARADVPAPVVISEYLDVSHAFFSDKEPALVNGVLDRLARTLRSEESREEGRDGA